MHGAKGPSGRGGVFDTLLCGCHTAPVVGRDEGIASVRHAIGEPTRLRIVETLMEEPATAKAMAARLGLVPNRLYYHLRILQSAGLVEAAGVEVKGRFAEQVYRTTSAGFGRELLEGAEPGERAAFFGAMLNATAREVHDVVAGDADGGAASPELRLSRGMVRTTPEGAAQLWEDVAAAVERAWSHADDPSARNYRCVTALYQPASAEETE